MSLILRMFGVVLTAALAAAALGGHLAPGRAQLPAPSGVDISPTLTAPLPATAAAAGPSLLERSPFAADRSAFSRNAGPPAPELEVRLAGVFKVGKEMRATLMIGGQSVTVRKGDKTPAGVVASIETSAVVLEGASTRRLEMFKP